MCSCTDLIAAAFWQKFIFLLPDNPVVFCRSSLCCLIEVNGGAVFLSCSECGTTAPWKPLFPKALASPRRFVAALSKAHTHHSGLMGELKFGHLYIYLLCPPWLPQTVLTRAAITALIVLSESPIREKPLTKRSTETTAATFSGFRRQPWTIII